MSLLLYLKKTYKVYFDKVSHGEVLSRVTNDVDTVSQSLNQSLSQIITSATTLVGVLIMMLSISWQMTIVALLLTYFDAKKIRFLKIKKC